MNGNAAVLTADDRNLRRGSLIPSLHDCGFAASLSGYPNPTTERKGRPFWRVAFLVALGGKADISRDAQNDVSDPKRTLRRPGVHRIAYLTAPSPTTTNGAHSAGYSKEVFAMLMVGKLMDGLIAKDWVADEPAGEAHRDRREGGEPRPLHRLLDGRGRHPTANVPGDSATAHCGNCGSSSHQRQRETFDDYAFNSNQRRIAPKCQGKWSDQPVNAIRDTGMPENFSHLPFGLPGNPEKRYDPRQFWGSSGGYR